MLIFSWHVVPLKKHLYFVKFRLIIVVDISANVLRHKPGAESGGII